MRKSSFISSKQKAIVFKASIFALVFSLMFISADFGAVESDFNIEKTAFLYEGGELVGINTGDDASLLATTYETQKQEVLAQSSSDAKLNTNVVESPSIINFAVPEEVQEETVEYAKAQTEVLEDGYTVSIDDEHHFYIDNEEDLKWISNQILLAYLPDKSYLEYYQNTGQFREFELGNKKFTGISVLNEIKISEGYKPGSKYVPDPEQLLFELFHKDQLRSYNVISDSNSIGQIKDANNLTEASFKINNPSLSEHAVTYDGQQIVVNELDPIIDVALSFESTKVEELQFETVTQFDDNLDKGQFEITQEGSPGEKTITYENIMVDNEVISTERIGEEVTKKPEYKIISVGPGTIISSIPTDEGSLAPSKESSNGFIWPSSSRRVTCPYGCYPGHVGIDIASYSGGPLYASKAGMVVTSGWNGGGYGYYVVIDHGGGVKTLYAHQRQTPPVVVGQYVQQGQVIGFEGTTGRSTGVHLHFEIQINGTAVNPAPYIY